jgi:hypothetical protein
MVLVVTTWSQTPKDVIFLNHESLKKKTPQDWKNEKYIVTL